MDKVRWKRLLLEITIWIVAEVVLSLFGMDNLADYGEFVFQDKAQILMAELLIQQGSFGIWPF
jgi:hypothetical protein